MQLLLKKRLDLGRKDSTGTCKPQCGICDFHISITFDDLDKPKDPVLAMPETYHDLMTMHVDYSNADTTEKNFIHDNLMKDSGLIYLSSRVLVDDADVLDYLHLCNPILFKPQNAIVQHVDLANEQFDVILRFKNMKRMADGTLYENDTEDIRYEYKKTFSAFVVWLAIISQLHHIRYSSGLGYFI